MHKELEDIDSDHPLLGFAHFKKGCKTPTFHKDFYQRYTSSKHKDPFFDSLLKYATEIYQVITDTHPEPLLRRAA